MTETTYTFSITNDFPNQMVNAGRLSQEINQSDITIALSHINTNEIECDVVFKDQLPVDGSSTLNTIISNHSGEALPTKAQPVSLEDEFRDKHGKLRVHQTSRKDGLAIHWTSEGDDKTNPHKFGKGESISYVHEIGDSTSNLIYIDFNGMTNESWIHEVVLTWQGCFLDKVSVDIVPETCSIVSASETTFSTYGPIVIPAIPGTGDVQITSDVLAYGGGLVERDSPSDPSSSPSPAFWDADWNDETHRFENLTANPDGQGQYNIFHEEITLNRTFNDVQLLGDGFQIFNSSDTDQLTHGLRLRCSFETRLPDHAWAISGIVVMHRKYVQVDSDSNFVIS